MTSITNELREYANTRISPNKGMLTTIADRIDAELTERYIVLPLDMDGKPIHFGDVMEMDGDSELYDVVGFYDLGFLAWRNGRFVPCAASLYRHHQPDTWERIIDDAEALAREWFNTDMSENEHAEGLDAIVARCKKLAEKEMS